LDVFPETSNDGESVAKAAEAAGRLGLEICRMKEPIRSSEDFGWFQKKCPGAMIFIGNGVDYPQVHTEEYDFNDNIIETAVELLYEIIMEA
ncbi:MAG: M20/M25/M40 family metallo-hydrolase, partial [Clostridia bacterium]|nr:M20/M25/M40 family metallo-hydrolase [Clostridia bacterium]